ncbi:MAG: hypothetical protein GY726_04735 [Proteobacteria bacterium]|nr:hypothetical protein [Pseudomonadota bacterium]
MDHDVHPTGQCGFSFRIPPQYNIKSYRTLFIKAGSCKTIIASFQTDKIPEVVDGVLPKVLFMHIPKTAGTSFNTFAKAYIPREKVIVHIESEDKEKYASFNSSYNYIAGHLPLRTLAEYFDLSAFDLYTILREPYRHLHSHFNWVKAVSHIPDSSFSLEHPQVVRDMSMNMQNMDLSQPEVLGDFVRNLEGFGLDYFDNCQTRYFLDYRPERVTLTHVDQALQNLQHFTGIGITEQYGAFTKMFCYKIKANFCEQQRTFNASKSTLLFDYNNPEIREALHPIVAADLLLYEYVRADISCV